MLYDGAPMTHQLPGSIAIDGPAASGKTTVGLAIAAEFGYSFLDTGLMYRGVTLAAPAVAASMRREPESSLGVKTSPANCDVRTSKRT